MRKLKNADFRSKLLKNVDFALTSDRKDVDFTWKPGKCSCFMQRVSSKTSISGLNSSKCCFALTDSNDVDFT